MNLSIYEVDAFADATFSGNPAAVVPLDAWLEDDALQSIAAQNNLSETAYCVLESGGYRIRWFTPTTEVDLCGHATLATAHVLISELKAEDQRVVFNSRSGELLVQYSNGSYTLDFPVEEGAECEIPIGLRRALTAELDECYFNQDYLVTVESQAVLESMSPDFNALKKLPARGIIVTAPGTEVDFVCRFFAPAVGIDEDPVTGSAFTKLTPYWSKRLNKGELSAKQISNRGGHVNCMMRGERVLITGQARTYLRGVIDV